MRAAAATTEQCVNQERFQLYEDTGCAAAHRGRAPGGPVAAKLGSLPQCRARPLSRPVEFPLVIATPPAITSKAEGRGQEGHISPPVPFAYWTGSHPCVFCFVLFCFARLF